MLHALAGRPLAKHAWIGWGGREERLLAQVVGGWSAAAGRAPEEAEVVRHVVEGERELRVGRGPVSQREVRARVGAVAGEHAWRVVTARERMQE